MYNVAIRDISTFDIKDGHTCMCGNSAPDPVVPEEHCSTSCDGDPAKECGGGSGYTSVYSIDSTPGKANVSAKKRVK